MISRLLPAFAVLLLIACAPAHAEEPAPALPPTIGYMEPYRIITVSTAETGILTEMLVNEGDAVKENQVLARLDTAPFTAELEVAKAEAQLQATRMQRIEELAASSRVSPDEIERTRTEVAVKNAQVRKVEAMIEARTLRSPVNGIVTDIKRDRSEAVSTAQPHVLTVVEIDRLIVNLYLPPATAFTLQPGKPANLLLLDEKNARVTGTVEYLSPVIDAASGTVRVKFVIENAERQHRAGGRCSLAP